MFSMRKYLDYFSPRANKTGYIDLPLPRNISSSVFKVPKSYPDINYLFLAYFLGLDIHVCMPFMNLPFYDPYSCLIVFQIVICDSTFIIPYLFSLITCLFITFSKMLLSFFVW